MFEQPTTNAKPQAEPVGEYASRNDFLRAMNAGKTLAEIKADMVSRVKDPVWAERKREILEGFNLEDFMTWLTDRDPAVFESHSLLRGYVFEYLVSREMNFEGENEALSRFLLDCLRHPEIIGLPEHSLRNPDHVGVVVDIEKKVAYVTGIYEVKAGKLDERSKHQLYTFYRNLDVVIRQINDKLIEVKEKYDLSFIPEGGIRLRAWEKIQQLLVVPLPINEREKAFFREKADEAHRLGWGVKRSIFVNFDIDRLTIYLLDELARTRRQPKRPVEEN